MLDIGTGPFALLAVIAAKAGAKKVYAIEKTLELGQPLKTKSLLWNIRHAQWLIQRTKWQCSKAMLVYQRVNHVKQQEAPQITILKVV